MVAKENPRQLRLDEPTPINGARFTLEPLCEATEIALSKVNLKQTDQLSIGLDKVGKKFLCRLQSVDPTTGAIVNYPPPSSQAEDFFNRLPETKFLGGKIFALRHSWEVAATDYFVLLVHHCWPMQQIHFEDQDAKKLFEYLLMRFALQHHRASIAAEFKTLSKVPRLPDDWIIHPDLPLSDYQTVAALMSMSQEAIALFMDKGTGKTATAIQAMCVEAQRKRKRFGKMYRCLIVCPSQVLLNWKLEIERFAVCEGKVVIIRGQKAERIKSLVEGITEDPTCDFGVVIIGYDSLSATEAAFCMPEWDRIIADESHYFKSNKTNRWETMLKIRSRAKTRMILTGTPIGNSPMDLWCQLEFLGEGLSGFQSFKEFRKFYGEFETVYGASGHGVEKLVGIKNVPLLKERLARLSFAITKEDAGLKLPDKVYDVLEVAMTERQGKIYDSVADELMSEIEDILSGEVNQLTTENILTRLMRLAQITSGFATYDATIDEEGTVTSPKRVQQIDNDNPKVVACIEALTAEDRDPLGKCIIWCTFVEDIQILVKKLKEAGVGTVAYYGKVTQDNRDEAVNQFNCNPDCKVMVANPQTAGEGLDLLGYNKLDPENSKTYCDMEIFFSQNWSAIQRSQAEDRAHRRGTRMPVRITDLVIPGTIDEEIRRRVRAKSDMAKSITDLREILDAVLRQKAWAI